MRKILILGIIIIGLISCRKPVNENTIVLDTENNHELIDTSGFETPPCNCFSDIDTCQCFNGIWNLRSLTPGWGGYQFFNEGYNVWFFDNIDSSVIICNSSQYGIASGNYMFSINNQEEFVLFDTLNQPVLTCCSDIENFYFLENNLIFDWSVASDGPGYYFKRNE